MDVHRCKICTLPERSVIESWRVKDGLSLREIQKRMADELGIVVSLGLLGNHFKAVDAAVVSLVEGMATANAANAMHTFPDNRTVLDKVVTQLMPDGKRVARPQWIPYLIAALKEKREAAQGELRYTPADPENKQAEAWADIARMAADRMRGDTDDESNDGASDDEPEG